MHIYHYIFIFFSPNLCVGFLFSILYPAPPPPRRLLLVASSASSTHNFVTHNFITHLFVTHTTLSHTLCHTPSLRGRRGTWRQPPSCDVAGVALVALGWVWWRAWSPLVARDAAALCVAGVALGDIHLRLMWQAWHTELFHTHTRPLSFLPPSSCFNFFF